MILGLSNYKSNVSYYYYYYYYYYYLIISSSIMRIVHFMQAFMSVS